MYWIDSHRSRHDSSTSRIRRRIRSPGSTVQSRIGQTETCGDHRLLGIRSGQLRDRIHLIQRQLAGSEPFPQHRQILEPTSHPNQLSCSRMTQTEPGRNPLGKVAGPIREELLAEISVDQPFTDLGVENRQTREQMSQNPIHLIIGKALPLHAPNLRKGCDRNRSETEHPKRNLRISQLPSIGRPTVSASRNSGSISLKAESARVPVASRTLEKKQRAAEARATSRMSRSLRPAERNAAMSLFCHCGGVVGHFRRQLAENLRLGLSSGG